MNSTSTAASTTGRSSSDRFQARRDQLLQRMASENVPALLVSKPTNVTYLTGFTGHDSYLLVSPQRTLMFSDSRYDTQLREECPGLECEIRTAATRMVDELARVLPSLNLASLGIEGDHFVYDLAAGLTAAITTPITSFSGRIEQIRSVKDDLEIAEIREAVRQAERGFLAALANVAAGDTELDFAFSLESAMRRFGGYRAAFEPIIAAGPRAALPHARATSARMDAHPLVLIDWGSEARSGYRSDLTRVALAGSLPTELERVYRVVLNAQRAAIAEIRAGASCQAIDAVARGIIADAGYGDRFGHGLGHGLGLDVHEQPRFSPISKDVLVAGQVMTVEPGIYLPGLGGVRIEDDVLVTEDGCEVLSSLPKDYDAVRITY